MDQGKFDLNSKPSFNRIHVYDKNNPKSAQDIWAENGQIRIQNLIVDNLNYSNTGITTDALELNVLEVIDALKVDYLEPSKIVTTDSVNNLTTDIDYATAATNSTLVMRDSTAGINVSKITTGTATINSLTADQLLVTDVSKNITTLPYSVSSLANTIVQRDVSSNINANNATLSGLTANTIVSTDSSKNLATVLAHSQSATGSSLVQRDVAGGITASNVVTPTVNSTTTETITGATGVTISATTGDVNVSGTNINLSGTINASGLSANGIVVTDASKNLSTTTADTAATNNTLVKRDGSGAINVGAINATSINLSGLTASRIVSTDGSKNLVSTLSASSTDSASTIMQRDSFGNVGVNILSTTTQVNTPSVVGASGLTVNSGFGDLNLTGTNVYLNPVTNLKTNLTASKIVATDASSNLTTTTADTAATNSTLVQRTSTGTINATGVNVSGLTASQVVATDVSKNLSSVPYSTSATASTLAQRDASGNLAAATINLSNLTASKLVSTNGSKNLVTAIEYDTLATANTLVMRDASGNIAATNIAGGSTINTTTLSASQLLALDASKNIVTLPYDATLSTANAIMQRNATGGLTTNGVTCSGTTTTATCNVTGLTASQAVVTDGSKNLASLAYDQAATNSTIVQRTGTGTINATGATLSGLTASQVVVTNASKNLASVAYDTAATASTILQRDASGNAAVVGLTATSATVSGTTTLNGLTASQAVVTNGSKQLASLAYATAATASTLVQRDASGNGTFAGITASSATVSGTISLGPATGDPVATITSRTIPAGQGAASERSELILFQGNDGSNGSGPDTITLRSPYIRLQTFDDGTITDINNNSGSVDRFTVSQTGVINIPGLTASQAVVTDSSKNLTSLGYATAATASTLVQRNASGDITGAAGTFSGFTVNGTSTFNGTVRAQSIAGWYNVLYYGATGNGSTDDSTAIASAFTAAGAGGCVYFPKGTYLCNSTITIGNDNVQILGEGVGSIVVKGGTSGTLFSSTSKNYLTVSNIQLKSTSSATTGAAIFLTTCNNTTITNVYMYNHYGGIELAGCNECVIQGCHFRSSYGDSNIKMYGTAYNVQCSKVVISNCTFDRDVTPASYDTNVASIRIGTYMNSIIVRGCSIYGGYYGIYVSQNNTANGTNIGARTVDVLIDSCIIQSCYSSGLVFDGGQRMSVVNCSIMNNGSGLANTAGYSCGIFIPRHNSNQTDSLSGFNGNLSIIGCRIHGNYCGGIVIERGSEYFINNNHIARNSNVTTGSTSSNYQSGIILAQWDYLNTQMRDLIIQGNYIGMESGLQTGGPALNAPVGVVHRYGIWCENSIPSYPDYIIMTGNVFRGNDTAGIGGTYGGNNVVAHNFTY